MTNFAQKEMNQVIGLFMSLLSSLTIVRRDQIFNVFCF